MAEQQNTTTPPGKVDMSAIALEIAKTAEFGSDETKFKAFEKEFVKKFYDVIGLSDIPEEFLNFTKFLDAYSGVLVKSVQNDLAIMNLTKRLAMFKLSENIAATEKKPEASTETPATEEKKAAPSTLKINTAIPPVPGEKPCDIEK